MGVKKKSWVAFFFILTGCSSGFNTDLQITQDMANFLDGTSPPASLRATDETTITSISADDGDILEYMPAILEAARANASPEIPNVIPNVIPPELPGVFPQPLINLSKLKLPLADSDIISTTLNIVGKTDYVVSGVRISNLNGPCLRIHASSNITITNSEIGPCKGAGILISSSNSVTVKGNYIHDTTDSSIEVFYSEAAHIIENQMARGASGVYAQGCQGVSVQRNRILNVQGPMPRGQLVQYNNVTGAGNDISCNQGQNDLGASLAEDAINIYRSSGVSDSHLQVFGNKIMGGGPSNYGGGIMLGDGGLSSFIDASQNILVNPGQYGMAVAGGKTITITNNKIFGIKQPFTNVGLYVWNQNPDICENISVSGNSVFWFNKSNVQNSYWPGPGCGTIADFDPVTKKELNNWNEILLAPYILNNVVPGCEYY